MLGIGWALLQPVFLMVVFSLLFGNLAGFDERTDVPSSAMSLLQGGEWPS